MTKSATVLVMDDNPELLGGISDLLEDLSYVKTGYQIQVVTAVDGRDGLVQMNQLLPDLIISDIKMPHVDGFEFLEQVRRNKNWVHIPVIFLTARGKKEQVWEGRKSGAELYITKPFNTDEFLGLVKSQLDQTFARQASHARQVNRVKNKLLQIINHEFRTPLTYVTAYTEILTQSVDYAEDIDSLQEYLQGIQTGCVRLGELVDDLVAILEIRTGETAARFNERAHLLRDVASMARQAGERWRAIAAQEGIGLEISVPDTLPPVFGDRESIVEVLDRLLDNAVKFIDRRPAVQRPKWVRLTATVDNGAIHIAIADTGIGFPEHLKDEIFDFMFQHNRDIHEQQGSGSGLTIARALVQLHHGRIDVRSEEGQGSTFTIVLPVHGTGPLGSRPITSRRSATRREATLLVVEDDTYLLHGLQEILELHAGPYAFDVMIAENGREGLNCLAMRRPDLIVSDVMMPVIGGYEFLKAVREREEWLDIPFIFLTARGDRKDIIAGRTSGAEEYITKPYEADELINLIVTKLDRYFQMRAARQQDFDVLKRSVLDLLQPDLRQPLSDVDAYSREMGTLLAAAQDEEQLKTTLHSIHDSSQQLKAWIEDFISLAELKTGQARAEYALRAQPIYDLGPLLHVTLEPYEIRAQALNIRLINNVGQDLPTVFGDFDNLLECQTRILAAALTVVQAGDGGFVELSSEVADSEVHIRVTCDGAGFPNEIVDQIQALIGQNDEAIVQSPEYGPRLLMAHWILELHQGRLSLSRDDNGRHVLGLHLPVHSVD